MALSAYERVGDKTKKMETAVYAALSAIDTYRDTVREVIAEQQQLDEPNTMLVKRMTQFDGRAEAMVSIIEDDVLTHLMFCMDRLFAVKLAEAGEFI